jgi:hypothetical protein
MGIPEFARLTAMRLLGVSGGMTELFRDGSPPGLTTARTRPRTRASCACVGLSAAGWCSTSPAAVRGVVAAFGRPFELL